MKVPRSLKQLVPVPDGMVCAGAVLGRGPVFVDVVAG